jgi:O-antigen biosynthesis protein
MLNKLVSDLVTRLLRHRPVVLGPNVSIGMAAYGNAATTSHALEALFASATGGFELILVDDASPDHTLEVFLEARKRHANTKVFSFRENLEYCNSVNAFLSHARGDFLIFLSNDIFVCPAYLRQLTRLATDNPTFGVLHGCSNFVDGSSPLHNIAVEPFSTMEELFAFGGKVARRHRRSPLIDERYLVGDAFLASRAVIEKIGTFDTRFFGYYCDQDFGLRAQIAGFRVGLAQSAFAFHVRNANLDYLSEAERRAKVARRHERVRNALGTFVQKYGLQISEASVNDLPWEKLSRATFDRAHHYVAPRDYSAHLVT